jgi:hypothetical protein
MVESISPYTTLLDSILDIVYIKLYEYLLAQMGLLDLAFDIQIKEVYFGKQSFS